MRCSFKPSRTSREQGQRLLFLFCRERNRGLGKGRQEAQGRLEVEPWCPGLATGVHPAEVDRLSVSSEADTLSD